MKVTKAVIPAAGFGTRFLPCTKATPKEMLPIVDTPTLQYIIEEAVNSGITDILIITGRGKEAIENHFDKSYELETELERAGKDDMLKIVRDIPSLATIHYIRQHQALGLGHAILRAKTFVGNEPFAVLLGDDIVYSEEKPALKQMLEVYEKYECSILGVQTVAHEMVSKYGVIGGEKVSDRTYDVKELVEKPALDEAPSDMAVLGRYIIEPEIFSYLEKAKPGKGGEIQLTDSLFELAKDKRMLAYDFIGRRYDVGSKEGFLEATVEFALRRDDLRDEFLDYLKKVVK